MRKTLGGLLVLASCSALQEGTEEYHEAMVRARYDPASAREHFARADEFLAEAMLEEDLDVPEAVTAAANRIRALIELDRHEDAATLLGARIGSYDPERRHEGDLVGLALVRAHHLDPERGYAHLVLAERWAGTSRARLHLAWQQARLLQRVGTPKARAAALKICEQNAGKLDFDAMKRALTQG